MSTEEACSTSTFFSCHVKNAMENITRSPLSVFGVCHMDDWLAHPTCGRVLMRGKVHHLSLYIPPISRQWSSVGISVTLWKHDGLYRGEHFDAILWLHLTCINLSNVNVNFLMWSARLDWCSSIYQQVIHLFHGMKMETKSSNWYNGDNIMKATLLPWSATNPNMTISWSLGYP